MNEKLKFIVGMLEDFYYNPEKFDELKDDYQKKLAQNYEEDFKKAKDFLEGKIVIEE